MSVSMIEPAWRRRLARQLVAWFERTARDLPWRRTRDLYAIWVSEIMLQQTQVATVIPYWERFLARFPTIRALAEADEREVLCLWEGLGYYRRARQLHAAARQIAAQHSGQFPVSYDAVRALPGVGRYTAGAILSIGNDARLPILEANSIRVLSRLTAFAGDGASAAGQKHLWSIAEAILPAKRCGTFNQALMELGSAICTPKSPGCDRCPVAALCAANRQQLVAEIPRPAAKTRYEEVTEVAVVVRQRGCVLLRRCQPGERWAGLWDFPRFTAGGQQGGALAAHVSDQMRKLIGIDIQTPAPLATLRHGITRFRITLLCWEAAVRAGTGAKPQLAADSRWVRINELAAYPLSVTGRKISLMLT